MQLLQLLKFNPNFYLFFVLYNIGMFFSIMERRTAHFSMLRPHCHNRQRKDEEIMKTRLIEYDPSPGSQVMARRRLCFRALTLWCGLWLHSRMVGGLAYVL